MMHNNMYNQQSNGQESCYDYDYYSSETSSSNSSYVDCTLSLGTPSTRSDIGNEKCKKQSCKRIGCGSRVSNFCWDLMQQSSSASSLKLSKGGHGGVGGGDQLVARRCANCDTTSTPLWRNGPKGSKSLCNACGIRYKKEERRATAAASTNSTTSGGGASAMDSQHGSDEHYYSNNSYTHNYNRYVKADDGNGAVSFLPLMINVADRKSLVHDFTR